MSIKFYPVKVKWINFGKKKESIKNNILMEMTKW